MNMDTYCTYQERREEVLIGYLYNDIDAPARAAFEVHLGRCVTCRHELEQLGVVRVQLEQWTPPEPARALSGAAGPSARAGRDMADRGLAPPASPGRPEVRLAAEAHPHSRWQKLREMPVWAQVAAAMLFVGVSAAVANLEVTYDSSGLSVRTGWMTPAPAPPAAAGIAGSVRPVTLPEPPAPWREDLAALELRMRDELRSSTARGARAGGQTDADSGALLVRVRQMIEESEQRQQRELALRIAEVDTTVRAQRIADLRNIERYLTTIQSNTGVDMRRLYEMTNDLAVKVSQTR